MAEITKPIFIKDPLLKGKNKIFSKVADFYKVNKEALKIDAFHWGFAYQEIQEI